jgi:hypothetical protein
MQEIMGFQNLNNYAFDDPDQFRCSESLSSSLKIIK